LQILNRWFFIIILLQVPKAVIIVSHEIIYFHIFYSLLWMLINLEKQILNGFYIKKYYKLYLEYDIIEYDI